MSTLDGIDTLVSLADLYGPDAPPHSPMLQARKLELCVTKSPSPDPTEVKPSRGDAVLIQYMGGGKNPDIYDTAGNDPLTDSSEEVDEDDADDEGSDIEKPVASVCAARDEPVPLRELAGLDRRPEPTSLKPPERLERPERPTAPKVVSTTDGGNDRPIFANSSTGSAPGHAAVAVASAALRLSEAPTPTARPEPLEMEINMEFDGAFSGTANSPRQLQPIVAGTLSLDDRKPSSSGGRSPSVDAYSVRGRQSYSATDNSTQLLTPQSMTTPQSSAGVTSGRDDRPISRSATMTLSLVTPSVDSPIDRSSAYGFSPNSLPPIHPLVDGASAKSTSPINGGGSASSASNTLPSFRDVLAQSGQDATTPIGGSEVYGRSYSHALPPPVSSGLPGVASLTSHSPPMSPNEYRHGSDMAAPMAPMAPLAPIAPITPTASSIATTINRGPYYNNAYSASQMPAAEYQASNSSSRHSPSMPMLRAVERTPLKRGHGSYGPTAAMAPSMALVPGLPRTMIMSRHSSRASEEGDDPADHHAARDAAAQEVGARQEAEAAAHHGGIYKCNVPGCLAAPFQTQYLLNSHANVHSSARPHYCPVLGCPRSKVGHGFKRKNEMIRHGLVHESPGYVCPFCPDREHRYPRPDNLQRHVRAHHKDKGKDDPQLRDVLAQRPNGASQRRRRRLA